MIKLGSTDMAKAYVGSTEVSKVYLGSELVWNSVPPTYETVEYIENTSTAYIDTGFTPNQDTRVILEFSISGYTSISGSSGYATILGTGNRTNNDAYIVFMNTSNKYCQPQYRGTYQSNNGTLTYGIKYTIDFNKNVFSCRNSYTFTAGTFTCPNTLCLCYIKSRTFHRGKCKIFSCKIYDNGTLVRDYIPKKLGTTYGLWDDVGGVFYTSPNNVAFSGGDIIQNS